MVTALPMQPDRRTAPSRTGSRRTRIAWTTASRPPSRLDEGCGANVDGLGARQAELHGPVGVPGRGLERPRAGLALHRHGALAVGRQDVARHLVASVVQDAGGDRAVDPGVGVPAQLRRDLACELLAEGA